MRKLIIDPPSGWRYGFPKECPESIWNGSDEDFYEWLIKNGYPSKDVEFAANNMRFWYDT